MWGLCENNKYKRKSKMGLKRGFAMKRGIAMKTSLFAKSLLIMNAIGPTKESRREFYLKFKNEFFSFFEIAASEPMLVVDLSILTRMGYRKILKIMKDENSFYKTPKKTFVNFICGFALISVDEVIPYDSPFRDVICLQLLLEKIKEQEV